MTTVNLDPTSLQERIGEALRMLGPCATPDVQLAPMTTYKVGGRAAVFVRPQSLDDLVTLAATWRVTELPMLVIGRGSNLLVADTGHPGIAVSLAELSSDIEIDPFATDAPSDQPVVVSAGGAVALPVLARRTVAAGLTGFEWAVGVPGSVGGGVRMNAGGHGSDMASALIDVDLFDLALGQSQRLPAGALGLRFRGSDLTDHQIVLMARLTLTPGARNQSQAVLDEVVRWRREHQPGGQNAGSVFVNPVPGQVTAGELIDRVGLRGLRIGTAHVSDKHANFIQADEGGLASDVRAVIDMVRARVADQTGYLLRSEVRLVGFEQTSPDVTP
ncbi:MAG: UDP-N-acetylenolpyruvoylglucosamine reductase [Ilumatobacteraceae bacterium]|nr:UDP-N-acetylenolpyruvoylglucosamine reductase [Ilumatobacteraceae bacterium]